MNAVHVKRPVRSSPAAKPRYQDYRDALRKDFNESCGYCDDGDAFRDRISFHVDHFAPQKQFPERATVYTNLVYSCRYCNIRKSNNWIGTDPDVPHDGTNGFVDPCSADFDKHLERDSIGRIRAVTSVGQYMVRKLSLSLIRHELLWQARQARAARSIIEKLVAELRARSQEAEKEVLLEAALEFIDLTTAIESYELAATA